MLTFSDSIDKKTGLHTITTNLKGKLLLSSPQLNKGTAFTETERHELNLLGKLPNHIETLEAQVERAYAQYGSFKSKLKKNIFLNSLHDNNQVLFFALVKQYLAEMVPTIYTPIVGKAVKQFSHEFRRTRGLYISIKDSNHIEEILDNRTHPEVDIIVVTDGEGVLGIGDQGVGGMDIPIAKLMVYTLCGGINHLRTLPICLDVGTNNQTLLDDPMYLGLRHQRIEGDEYHQFIKKFIAAIKKKFPWVFLHWEDFGRNNARPNLDHFRHDLCSFNDDIQGTGVITVAALLAAVLANQTTLSEQKIVVFGAGSAGTGITDCICNAMVKSGIPLEQAKQCFWLIDRQGLLTDQTHALTAVQTQYVRPQTDISDWPTDANGYIDLATVIEQVKPTVLLGCSAVAGAFTETIIRTMHSHTKRPIIFPLSNPTDRAEATAEQLIQWTDGQALIATGSPFDAVTYHEQTIQIAQCNNALAFPGIGLAVIATHASEVTDEMLWAASQAIASQSPMNQDVNAPLLPPIDRASTLAIHVAKAVAQQAREQKLDTINQNKDIDACIHALIWQPIYPCIKSQD